MCGVFMIDLYAESGCIDPVSLVYGVCGFLIVFLPEAARLILSGTDYIPQRSTTENGPGRDSAGRTSKKPPHSRIEGST